MPEVDLDFPRAFIEFAGRLKDGRWLLMPFTILPEPQNREKALLGWVLAMLAGTTLVMVVAVRRLTAPLALLEQTVAAIGPDGEIAPLDRIADLAEHSSAPFSS